MSSVDSTLLHADATAASLEYSSAAEATLAAPAPGLMDRLPAQAGAAEPELLPILVADDDADDLFFVQRLIRKTGVRNPVKTFEDGSEVVNYLGARLACVSGRARIPQLLFLDLKMAGLGGFGFLEWARQQKGLLPLKIVVLSNSNESENVARALELGAHRYLVKYPCVQTMTTIVRSVCPYTLA